MIDETPVEIRRATAADAEAIADVWLTSFKATYAFPPSHPDDDVRRWVRDEVVPRRETWVAVDPGGGVCGFMVLHGDDLDQLYLLPDRTRRGIGSRLLELAKAQRPGGLGLFTFQVNRRARAFYERHGFVVEYLGDGASNEERQPDVRYGWRPSPESGDADRRAVTRTMDSS
jgi:GNAT superfamily N-acetyltransferase